MPCALGVHYDLNGQDCWRKTHSLGPFHFRTAPAVSSAAHTVFLDKTSTLYHIIGSFWDHHFGRGTAQGRLDLKFYTSRRTMIQTFAQLLFELLGYRVARIDIEVESFLSHFSPRTTNI